jgi:hypothetical protein
MLAALIMAHKDMFISTRVSVPSSEMGPFTPSATSKYVSSHFGLGKEPHSLAGKRVGDPIPTTGQKLCYSLYTIIPLRSGRTSWRWLRATASFRLRESTRRLRRTGRPSSRDSSLGGQFKFLSVLAQRDCSLLLKTKLTRQFSRRTA